MVLSNENKNEKHCAVAIKSILDNINTRQKIKFFIVHDKSFLDFNKGLLSNYETPYISVEYLQVNISDFSFYPLNRPHISIATYYRLALHKILPANVRKIIYLDADLVVMDSLVELWSIDLESNYLAGSPDEGGVLQMRRLGLPLSHNYINAGICVMNIAKMREVDLDNLYAEALYKNYELITLQDQDILNITFVNKIKRIHPRWNVQSRFYKPNELEYAYTQVELNEAALDPAIIHFSDREKPWQPACRHTLKSFYKYYEEQIEPELRVQKYNHSISDFITYDIRGDIVEIFISFKDGQKSFTMNTKFARAMHKAIKWIFSLWKK